MAISLIAAVIRHERRVRLTFSNTLALAAFASTSFYGSEQLDGIGANPTVVKALIVADSPDVVELQLSTDLVQGGRYRFSAVGVPAIDLSVTPDPSDVFATVPEERGHVAVGAIGHVTDLERTLFGVDIAVGDDFAETPDGDLATLGGIACAKLDLQRAVGADGLPWDPTYGFSRQDVDGAPKALVTLRGRAVRLMKKDDRIAAASAEIDLTDPAGPVLLLRPTWIGARGAQQAPVRARFSSDR